MNATVNVHPVDEVLPAPRLAALGLQHVLVMYAGAVAVWRAPAAASSSASVSAAAPAAVSMAQVKAVVDQRCVLCHNAQIQQKNIALHTPDLIKAHAQSVYQQVVVLKLMPFGNATQMTDAERALIGRWFVAGAATK